MMLWDAPETGQHHAEGSQVGSGWREPWRCTGSTGGSQGGKGEELGKLEHINRKTCRMETSAVRRSSHGATAAHEPQAQPEAKLEGQHRGGRELSLLSQGQRLHAEDKDVCFFWFWSH